MTPRPVGPGRAEWLAASRARLAEVDDDLEVARRFAARSQRALDDERQRVAALVAAVRAVVDAPAVGCTVPGVQGVLRAALIAYEGRRP